MRKKRGVYNEIPGISEGVSRFSENSLVLSEGVASEEVYRLKKFLKI